MGSRKLEAIGNETKEVGGPTGTQYADAVMATLETLAKRLEEEKE
jgi:hypothetical protein